MISTVLVSKRATRFFTVAVSALWILVLYGNVLFHPDDYMFSSGADGIKNYFTFAYHVHYDTSWLQFEGTNFPYHEHVGYTDGHPALSLLLGWIPGVKNHPVGFLNLFLLLSTVLTSWILFELLCTFKVSFWLAAIGALAINWMNPQVFRLAGHFALSYAWIIPLGILLVFKFHTYSNWKYVIYFVALSCFTWFIHPYLGMALALLGMTFLLFDSVLTFFSKKFQWKRVLGWLSLSIFPLLFYFVFIKTTDSHLDRAPDAKGFLEYTATYDCFFVPNHPPFRHFFSQILKLPADNWESWCYIGLSTLLIILISLLFKLKTVIRFLKDHPFWIVALLSSFVITLFACGFPFKNGHEDWLDKIPFIRQFRAPGRFAWVMYYVITSFAFVILSNLLFSKQTKYIWSKPLIILGVAALFFTEGYSGQTENSMAITAKPNLFNLDFITAEERAKIEEINTLPERPKAILPVPFFHYGSDYYGVDCNDESKKMAYVVAYHTGIPLIASANPRVSLSESRAILNLFGRNIFYKEIWDDIQNDPSIYLLQSGGEIHPEEIRFREYGSSVFRVSELKQGLLQALDRLKLMQVTSLDSTHLYFKEEFSKEEGGKLLGYTPKYNVLYRISSDRLKASVKWNASIWVYFEHLNALSSTLRVAKTRNDSTTWMAYQGAANSFNQFRDSVFVELEFEVESGYDYCIFSKGSEIDSSEVWFDHFMLRPSDLDVFERRINSNGNIDLKYNNWSIVIPESKN
jgi:hypothetical protein